MVRTMPRIFHNPPTQFILQIRLHQPHPKPLVITLRPLMNLPPRNPKLRTTRNTHFIRDLHARKQLHEARLEVFTRVHVIAVGIGVRTDFDGTSENPRAAQIHVALFLEIGDLEVAEHADAVVVGVIVVPLVLLGVDEEEGFGEAVVVVDDIPSPNLSIALTWLYS